MPVQLVKLRGVLEEEAQELRELLGANGIDYYETPAGNWGISSPGIWLRDDRQLTEARALVETYQRERAARVRDEYRQLKESGQQRTLLQTLREHPLRVLVYLVVVALVLYASTVPFISLGG